MAWFPFDYIIVEAIWPSCYTSQTARYVSLLKLLRLVRRLLVICPIIMSCDFATYAISSIESVQHGAI